MALIASDTFTGSEGTELSAYSASWVRHSTSDPSYGYAYIKSNRCSYNYYETAYYHTAVPASPNYWVEGDITMFGGAGGSLSLLARCDPASATYYMLYHSNAYTRIYKRLPGGWTQLGEVSGFVAEIGQTKHVKIEVEGSAVRIYTLGSSTPALSVSDSSITAAGRSGLRGEGASDYNFALDNFSAESAGDAGVDMAAAAAVQSNTTSSKVAISGLSADQGLAGGNTVSKIAVSSLDARSGLAADVSAAPAPSAGDANIAAVLGLAGGLSSQKTGIAGQSADIDLVGANSAAPVGTVEAHIAAALGAGGGTAALKEAIASLQARLAIEIASASSKSAAGALFGALGTSGTVVGGSVPVYGGGLSPEDLAAIADVVWAHADAVAAHAKLDEIITRLTC